MKEIFASLKFGILVYMGDLYIDMKSWYGMFSVEISVIIFIVLMLWLIYMIKMVRIKKRLLLKYIAVLVLIAILTKLLTSGDALFYFVDNFINSKVATTKIILGIGLLLVVEPISIKYLNGSRKNRREHSEILDV